jgi:hypothetical protein
LCIVYKYFICVILLLVCEAGPAASAAWAEWGAKPGGEITPQLVDGFETIKSGHERHHTFKVNKNISFLIETYSAEILVLLEVDNSIAVHSTQ